MDETRSFTPRQRITRAQAIIVYREAIKVLSAYFAAKGEDFSKEEFDENVQWWVDDGADQAGPFPKWALGRWVSILLSEIEREMTTNTRKMSQHNEEWGSFLSGGHLYTDKTEGVAQCRRIAKLAGIKFDHAKITRYATGNSV